MLKKINLKIFIIPFLKINHFFLSKKEIETKDQQFSLLYKIQE